MSKETENNLFGLKNIYLNNSIFTGLLTQICCEGHTVNFGNNGAGKTTILNLIPIFYGLKPNRLITQRGNKLSFVDFYLPYETSVIVFEYLKKGEVRNALIFRHNDTFRYCFIKGDAASQLFTEESISALNTIGSAEGWIKQYLKINKNYYVSKIIDNTELYQAVLMNHRDIISQRRDRSEFALMASQFSLCDLQEEIRNLASLSAVMLSDKSRLIEELKQMLVMCYISNQISITLPKSKQGRTQLEELEAISDLSGRIKDFNHAVEIKKEIADSFGYITECESKLKTILEENSLEKEKAETDLSAKREELKKVRDEFNRKTEDYHEQLTKASHSKKSLENLIGKIEEEKEQWDLVNIVEKTQQYSRLSEYREQLNLATKYLNELTQDISDKITPIELTKTRRENELNQEKAALFKKLTATLAECQTHISAIEEKYKQKEQQLKDSLQSQRENLDTQFQERKNAINEKINSLTSQKVTDGTYTPEEQLSLDTASRDLEKYSLKLNENLKIQTDTQSNLVSITSELNDKEREIAALVTQQQHLLHEKDDLLLQLNPPETSVIGFMESHMPNWRAHVGKVLRKDLLFQKGLKPYLDKDYDGNENSGSIYGLGLDLDAIEAPSYIKSRHELEEQSISIDEKLYALDDEINKQDKTRSNISERLEKEKTILNDLKREEKNLRENQLLSKHNLEEKEKEYKENIKKRLSILNEEINSSSLEKNRLEISYKKNKDKLEELFKKRQFDYKADCGSELEPYNTTEAELSAQLSNLDGQYEEKLRDLEKNFHVELYNSKIDYAPLEKAKNARDRAKTHYETVKHYEDEVLEYQKFMASDYALLEDYREKLAKAEDSYEEYSRLISVEKMQFEEIKGNLSQKIESLNSQIEVLEKKSRAINDFFVHNSSILNLPRPEFDKRQYLPENPEIEDLIVKCREKLSLVQDKQNELIKNVDEVRHTMENQTGRENRIAGYWKQIIDAVKIKLGEEYSNLYHDIRYYFALTDRLNTFIANDFKELRRTIITAFVSSAVEFVNFYENLRHFNRVVHQVSGKFAQRLSTYNPLDTITDIRIGLISKIENLEIYPKLQNFTRCYNEWEEENRNLGESTYPSPDLVKYYTYVSQALINNEIDSEINSLVDISISMNINGRLVTVRSDKDLTAGGSTGESKLAINVIFCALTRMICPNEHIKIHWPIDEIGEIYTDNLIKIFEMTERYGIYLFCAQPNLSYDKVQMFDTKNLISRTEGVKRCVAGFEEEPDNPIINMLTNGEKA